MQQIRNELPLNPFDDIFEQNPHNFKSKIPDIYEITLNPFDERFKQNFVGLKDKVSENYNWKIVPALHVHHTYYQTNLYPWEYPDSSLQTLCWICHEKLHKDQRVPFLDENGRQFSTLTPCTRCYGAGWFPEYKHIEEGICFRCRGAKYEELIQADYKM